MVLAFQLQYFYNIFHLLDFMAVAVSLVFEILIVLQESSLPIGLLVVMRAWRFIRVADHGIINRRVGLIADRRKKNIRKEMFRKLAIQNLKKTRSNNTAYNFELIVEDVAGSSKRNKEILKDGFVVPTELLRQYVPYTTHRASALSPAWRSPVSQ